MAEDQNGKTETAKTETPKGQADPQRLVEEAARAFGLRAAEIMAAAVRDGLVTLVTIGAHKVRWRRGDKVEPLHDLHAGRSIKPAAPPKA